jgi:hypothetical protein
MDRGDRERRRTERAVSALRRIEDISVRVVRGLWTLAIAAAACVCVAWSVWVVDTPVHGADGWVTRTIVLGALLVPPAVLLLFVSGLRELAGLPERVLTFPTQVRTHAEEVGARSRRTAEPRGMSGLLSSLFRLARLAWGSRDLLSPYATISLALRPAILLAALGATAAALLEVPVSLLAILVMVVA